MRMAIYEKRQVEGTPYLMSHEPVGLDFPGHHIMERILRP